MFSSGSDRAARVRRNKQVAAHKSRRRQAGIGRTLQIEGLEHRNLLSATISGYATPDYALYAGANGVTASATSSPTGYSPAQIRAAYGINAITFSNGAVTGNGSGTTIAIVDAYNDPNIASDLHQFDLQYGIADTTLTVVNETGGSSLPSANASWAMEISLDVEWAHAIAPAAKILLVEANSASYSDLLTAVKYAASASGVVTVSMSWGGSEFSGETGYDSYFTTPSGHAGVTFVASSGDSAAPTSYPSASPNVLSVGGTTLTLSSGSYGSESAWSDSGGGISAYESQPGYQKGIVTQSTTYRTNPDVSYDADPNTGFSVYDSYGSSASTPWIQVGGTSAGAPQWAAIIAIADQGRALAGKTSLDGATQTLAMLYALPSSDFHDITSGKTTGSPNYSAATGYDLATGRGTPYANLVVAGLVGSSTTTTTTATHFSVVASSSSDTAGTSFTITVTALDASNNTVTGYTGAVQFSSSDSAAIADGFLPANYTFTSSDKGVHTFTVTLATAGSESVTATDTASSSLLGSVAVTVNPGALDHIAFGQQPTSVAPGVAITPAVTVRLLDHYNNLLASDNTDQVTIAIGTNAGSGALSGTATVTAVGGVATFSNLAISQPGTGYTLRATDGSLSATSVAFNVASATSSVIESFDGSRNYYVVGGSRATASLSTAAKHDGIYGLLDSPGNDWIYRNDSAVQVKQGDTISVWLEFSGAADGRAYFGFGASSAGTLSLVAAPNTNQLLIQNNSGWGYTNIGAVNQTWQANHWYRLEIDWGTSGQIIGKLFDSNGTTLLATVTASTSAITSGGIAFRATGSYNKFWDTVTATPGVNQFVQPAAASSPTIPQDAAWQNGAAAIPVTGPRAREQEQLADLQKHALEAWFTAFGAASPTTTPAAANQSSLSLDAFFAQLKLSGKILRDL